MNERKENDPALLTNEVKWTASPAARKLVTLTQHTEIVETDEVDVLKKYFDENSKEHSNIATSRSPRASLLDIWLQSAKKGKGKRTIGGNNSPSSSPSQKLKRKQKEKNERTEINTQEFSSSVIGLSNISETKLNSGNQENNLDELAGIEELDSSLFVIDTDDLGENSAIVCSAKEENIFAPQMTDEDSKEFSEEFKTLESLMDDDLAIDESEVNSEIKKKYYRFIVQKIEMGIFEMITPFGSVKVPEKVVEVRCTHGQRTLHLREDWFNCHIQENDIINVVMPLEENNTVIVNNTSGILIVLPDILISGTSLSDSFSCLRRSILSSKIQDVSYEKGTSSMITGTILHDVFQKTLVDKTFDLTSLRQKLEKTLIDYVEDIYCTVDSEYKIKQDIEQLLPNLQYWFSTFISNFPKETATVLEHRFANKDRKKINIAISEVIDIEDSIWSPCFGLKGKIDATVNVVYTLESKLKNSIVPLELKTGKVTTNPSHRAQTVLYTILLSDKYNIDVDFGLLYYMSNNEILRVPKIHDEIRALFLARNEMARFLSLNNFILPPMIQNDYICSKCFQNENCLMLYKKGRKELSGMDDLFEKIAGGISEKQSNFIEKWFNLIHLEESDYSSFRKDIWTKNSEDRESEGLCFSKLKMISSAKSEKRLGSMAYVEHTFESKNIDANFTESRISLSDPIVVSEENGACAVGIGFILRIEKTRIFVSLDRSVKLDMSKTFRIDKDQLTNGNGLLRSNLLRLVRNEKLSSLLIDQKVPEFDSFEKNIDELKELQYLNTEQQFAIRKCLSTKDYCLILGMPGTGKSTAIAVLIKLLVRAGLRVVLSGYTHNSIDNILLKLIDSDVNFLRVGNQVKILPEIRKYSSSNHPEVKSIKDLELFYKQASLVATTCLSINHPIFVESRFDVCIVDEASQITVPAIIGPLLLSDRFILVGDHFQLSPLVRNAVAAKEGLAESLFETLLKKHPQSLAELKFQYRMNQDIMDLANLMVYEGKLKCGSEKVKIHKLDLNSPVKFEDEWLNYAVDPKRIVMFFDTDSIGIRESEKGKSICNEGEAKIIGKIVDSLKKCGISEKQIGILSPYKAQVAVLISHLCPSSEVEVQTIDSYQGRDKDCILISFVRSNNNLQCGELLSDLQRINVALTRAKRKLIMIGSTTTLRSSHVMNSIIDFLHTRNQIYRVYVHK